MQCLSSNNGVVNNRPCQKDQIAGTVLERGPVDAGKRGAVAKETAHPHAHKLRADIERRVGQHERRSERRGQKRVHL